MMAWGLPRRASRFLTGIVLLAAASLVAAVLCLRPLAFPLPQGVGIVLLAGGALALHFVSFPFHWKGQRMAIHADEGLLLVAFLVLPWPVVVLTTGLATLVAELGMRRARTKMAFNVAVHVVSTTLGALAFLGMDRAGLAPLASALVVPLVVSMVNQAILAELLFRLSSGTRNLKALAVSIALSSASGIVLGVTAVALYAMHPIAVLLVAPVALLVWRALAIGYQHENEATMREALAAATRSMLSHPSPDAVVDAALASALEGFAPRSVTIRVDLGEGSRAWTRANVTPGREADRMRAPLTDADGSTLGEIVLSLAAAPSLRDQQLLDLASSTLSLGLSNARTLDRLARSERRLRDAFEASPDPILLLDGRGTVIHANHAAETALDWAPRICGAHVGDIFRDISMGPTEQTFTPTAPDVARSWEGKLSPLRLEDGQAGNLLVTRETTERRRLERDAKAKADALAHAERLAFLGTLVAGVAHEINNPLMYMGGNVDLLKMDIDDIEARGAAHDGPTFQEIRGRLDSVSAGVARISEITAALNHITPSAREEQTSLDLADLLSCLAPELSAVVPARVVIALDIRSPGTVRGSPREIKRALTSLVKNAADAYEGREGSIRMGLDVGENAAIITIADDGSGMDEDTIRRATSPFFTTRHDRVGLGLTAVLATVHAHGGSMDITSTPGEGTRVGLRMPLVVGGSHPTPTLLAKGRHDA